METKTIHFLYAASLTFTCLVSTATAAHTDKPTQDLAALAEMKQLIELAKVEDLTELNVKIAELRQSPDKARSLIRAYADDAYQQFDSENGMEREKNFNKFLIVSDQVFPDAKICEHFYDCYERNISNLAGLNVLVRHYQKKDMHRSNFKRTIAIRAQELTAELDKLEQEKFEGEANFLILQQGKHISPVLIKRTNQGSTAIVLDSLGKNGPYQYGETTEALLRKSTLHPLQVYKVGPGRQKDGMSCPVFSFRDVVENSKVSLFEYVKTCGAHAISEDGEPALKETSTDSQGCSRSFHIDVLPPNFMKTVQIPQIMGDYLSAFPEHAGTVVSGKENDAINLRSHYEKYLSKSGNPFSVRRKAFKHYGTIVKVLIGDLGHD